MNEMIKYKKFTTRNEMKINEILCVFHLLILLFISDVHSKRKLYSIIKMLLYLNIYLPFVTPKIYFDISNFYLFLLTHRLYIICNGKS